MNWKSKYKSKNSKIESKKCWGCLVTVLLAGVLSGQSVLSKIPASGDSYSAFIPAGYDTLAIARGDLNNDQQEDLVIALKSKMEGSKDADPNIEPPGRLLVILFKTAEGFKTAIRKDSIILCQQCGGVYGDPFAMMEIKKNVLTISHFGGSSWKWELTHRFRFQQNDFYLIGETNYSYWGKYCQKLEDWAGTNLKDINYLTGQFEEKEITEECKLKVNKKGKRKVESLKKLSDFRIEN